MSTDAPMSSRDYPVEWHQYVDHLAGRVQLDIAGFSVHSEITRGLITRVYLPLLWHLHRSSSRRLLAGLTGIPGSGKSTFAAMLQHVADAVLAHGDLVVIGMDGWHYTNDELARRSARDEAGDVISLRQRKGGPESFDVDALANALRRVRDAEQDIALPVYDRRRHDPVADGVAVPASARIVLVEGNYMLNRTPPWDRVSGQLDVRLYLVCDESLARQRVIDRHIRGGLTADEAHEKFEKNDRLNTRIVLNTLNHADLIIRLDDTSGVLTG